MMRPLPRTALVLILLLSFRAHAAIHLIKDINPGVTGGAGVQFSAQIALNGLVLGTLDDGIHGQEMWKTDGTPSDTMLVKDIAPGIGSSGIQHLTLVGQIVYFLANDLTNGLQLWRSDGTEAGTHIVAAIRANNSGGAADEGPIFAPLATIQGILYFTASDAAGPGLWRSDGTATGTYRLSPAGTTGAKVVATSQRVFFVGNDSAGGDELWVSDGTTAGTGRVTDFYPGAQGSSPGNLTVTTAGLFFTAYNGSGGRKLLFVGADGSGVHAIADIGEGDSFNTVVAITAFGADVLFSANTPTPNDQKVFRASSSTLTLLTSSAQANAGFVKFGNNALFTVGSQPSNIYQLWTTDGTPAGTKQLGAASGLVVAETFGGPFTPTSVGSDGVYFGASTGNGLASSGLWRSDGTKAGTQVYAALPNGFFGNDLAQLQGKIFFAAGTPDTGQELWVSDGTPNGTHLFADLVPGTFGSAPLGFISTNGRLFFTAFNGTSFTPWTSDGTVAGTYALTNGSASQGAGSTPTQLTPFGNRLYFAADDGTHGWEYWSTDGTSAGTSLFKDINPGSAQGSNVIYVGGGLLLFTADDGVHGYELWASDGTVAGTHMVKDINPGPATSSITLENNSLIVLNGIAYFGADDGTHGWELWRSDGTSAGTFMIADLNPGAGASLPHSFRILNNQVLFVADIGNGGQWWTTDGTAAGTKLVAPSAVTQDTSVVFNGLLYFAGQQPPAFPTKGEVWVTDGTDAGTHLAVALTPGQQAVVGGLYPVGARLLMLVSTGANYQLFSSDGTAAGTFLLSNDQPQDAPVWNGSQLFYHVSAPDQSVLRATDGTVAGTHDVVADPSIGNGSALYVYKNSVIFTKRDPAIGPSIWRTDGTTAGTQLVAAIEAEGFQAFNNSLYFAGVTNATGEELFSVDETSPNTADDAASTPAATAVTISVLSNDGSLIAAIDPNSVAVSVAPANGTATVITGTGEISYTPATGFSGVDQFSYTVMDTLGHQSNPANVYVTVAAAAGPAPSGGTTTATGGHGGGGELSELQIVLLVALWAITLVRRRTEKVGAMKARHNAATGSYFPDISDHFGDLAFGVLHKAPKKAPKPSGCTRMTSDARGR